MHLLPVMNVSAQNGSAGERLGVIPVQSVHSAIFRDITEHVITGEIFTP